VVTKGKFFFVDGEKFFIKGVTYGPFAPASHGAPFPERERIELDFALMREMGANTFRTFTVPPRWLLDMAGACGLRVIVGIPWAEHIAFLDSPEITANSANNRKWRESMSRPHCCAGMLGGERDSS
jgi:beta-galactosidase/beta-glucuronidase